MKLMMPDGRLPDINDGKMEKSRDLLLPKSRILPENQKIRYIVTDGRREKHQITVPSFFRTPGFVYAKRLGKRCGMGVV